MCGSAIGAASIAAGVDGGLAGAGSSSSSCRATSVDACARTCAPMAQSSRSMVAVLARHCRACVSALYRIAPRGAAIRSLSCAMSASSRSEPSRIRAIGSTSFSSRTKARSSSDSSRCFCARSVAAPGAPAPVPPAVAVAAARAAAVDAAALRGTMGAGAGAAASALALDDEAPSIAGLNSRRACSQPRMSSSDERPPPSSRWCWQKAKASLSLSVVASSAFSLAPPTLDAAPPTPTPLQPRTAPTAPTEDAEAEAADRWGWRLPLSRRSASASCVRSSASLTSACALPFLGASRRA